MGYTEYSRKTAVYQIIKPDNDWFNLPKPWLILTLWAVGYQRAERADLSVG